MRTVEVAVLGGETYEVSLADLGTDPTYGDLLSVTEFGPHEVSVLVDGTPVPEDEPVSADRVEVLRLVAGGSGLPAGP